MMHAIFMSRNNSYVNVKAKKSLENIRYLNMFGVKAGVVFVTPNQFINISRHIEDYIKDYGIKVDADILVGIYISEVQRDYNDPKVDYALSRGFSVEELYPYEKGNYIFFKSLDKDIDINLLASNNKINLRPQRLNPDISVFDINAYYAYKSYIEKEKIDKEFLNYMTEEELINELLVKVMSKEEINKKTYKKKGE